MRRPKRRWRRWRRRCASCRRWRPRSSPASTIPFPEPKETAMTMNLARRAAVLLFVGLLAAPAWAGPNGSPDPSGIPVLQAMRTQVYALDRDVLLVTGIVAPEDLPILQKLADDLARIDAQYAIAAAGGDSGGP